MNHMTSLYRSSPININFFIECKLSDSTYRYACQDPAVTYLATFILIAQFIACGIHKIEFISSKLLRNRTVISFVDQYNLYCIKAPEYLNI